MNTKEIKERMNAIMDERFFLSMEGNWGPDEKAKDEKLEEEYKKLKKMLIRG